MKKTIKIFGDVHHSDSLGGPEEYTGREDYWPKFDAPRAIKKYQPLTVSHVIAFLSRWV